jgi:putative ABC transport system substrate-binding protein
MHRIAKLIFALGLALVATPSSYAQQSAKMARVGFLWPSAPGAPAPLINAFRQGLRELDWVEGQNLIMEYRFADGKPERFPALVGELSSLPVDVIVAGPAPAAVAAKTAVSTIPIVITLGADPVAFGLMEGLSPQVGNITGLTEITPELTPKRLTLLKESIPSLSRVALLWHAGVLQKDTIDKTVADAKTAARVLGLEIQLVEAKTNDSLEVAFDEITKGRAEAVVVLMSPAFNAQTKTLADLANKHKLPTVYEFRGFAAAGGLMSYGADFGDVYRRAAKYVDRLLKGAKASDLPVAGPSQIELVVNLKAAKELGVTIPQSVLQQARDVIQ